MKGVERAAIFLLWVVIVLVLLWAIIQIVQAAT